MSVSLYLETPDYLCSSPEPKAWSCCEPKDADPATGGDVAGQQKGSLRNVLPHHPLPRLPRSHSSDCRQPQTERRHPGPALKPVPSTPPAAGCWRGGQPLTWEAVVPAALHVESRQVQPDSSHLLEQPVPELIH